MSGDRELKGRLDALGDRLGIGSSAVREALVRLRVLEADMQSGSPFRRIARVGAEPQMCSTQAERLGISSLDRPETLYPSYCLPPAFQ